jgi:hypothetical protein
VIPREGVERAEEATHASSPPAQVIPREGVESKIALRAVAVISVAYPVIPREGVERLEYLDPRADIAE